MSEIIFEVREDEVDGGITATALGYGIHTQGDTLEELRTMVKDAVDCYFDETMEAPQITPLWMKFWRGEATRDVDGRQLVGALRMLGYAVTRRKGSHIRVTTQQDGENHEVIPYHHPIKTGTLWGILKRIAAHRRGD